jgi:hypothetical protein
MARFGSRVPRNGTAGSMTTSIHEQLLEEAHGGSDLKEQIIKKLHRDCFPGEGDFRKRIPTEKANPKG